MRQASELRVNLAQACPVAGTPVQRIGPDWLCFRRVARDDENGLDWTDAHERGAFVAGLCPAPKTVSVAASRRASTGAI